MTPTNGNGSRNEIERYLAAGEWAEAVAALRELWARQPTAATAGFVCASVERLRPQLDLTPCRLFILRSFTLEPAVPLLRAAAFLGGIDLTVKVGEFNAYAQEILNPESALYAFRPDVVILAVQARDIAPALWENFADLSTEERAAAAAEVVASFRNWISVFRERSQASLIVHGLELPAHPAAGALDAQGRDGQSSGIAAINGELRRTAAGFTGVYFLDYDALVARTGRDRWHDERKWLTVRMPVRAENLPALTAWWIRYLHPLTGRIAKVLVTDLDNTLWGGVVGEDGVEGIQAGREYPGAAFYALQRAMLDLNRRGILLAIASKNNPEDALRALTTHPGMLLRPEHFSAMRLDWDDKAANLRSIASELNVGIDSLAFLDDNPAERRRVRMELPEVTVIELPPDPLGYAAALREHPVFERLSLSAEDAARAGYYAQQRRREELQHSAGSLEDFYRSLGQRVEIAPLAPASLARAAQLTHKTNQFNLTTRRYSEQQIAAFAAEPGCEVWTVQVNDRFGDNGLVGVAMTRRQGEVCEIDTFLLSCRVIGRTVETAVLAFLAARNRALGAAHLEGWYLPTRKNAPAASFYRDHRFALAAERDGAGRWSLDLRDAGIACPPWIDLSYPKEPVLGEHVHA